MALNGHWRHASPPKRLSCGGGSMQTLVWGSTQTLELKDLAPGHYVALCNLLAHYGKGMHAEFTVK